MAINGRIQREGEVVHLVAQQLFDLSADLSGLADRDTEFKLPTGRGDEFAHGGGPDARDKPKPVMQARDMFVRDLHIDTLKLKSRNFIDFAVTNYWSKVRIRSSDWILSRGVQFCCVA